MRIQRRRYGGSDVERDEERARQGFGARHRGVAGGVNNHGTPAMEIYKRRCFERFRRRNSLSTAPQKWELVRSYSAMASGILNSAASCLRRPRCSSARCFKSKRGLQGASGQKASLNLRWRPRAGRSAPRAKASVRNGAPGSQRRLPLESPEHQPVQPHLGYSEREGGGDIVRGDSSALRRKAELSPRTYVPDRRWSLRRTGT